MHINFLTRFFMGLLNFYQHYISTGIPHACRFYPSCSEYTKQAILKYGLAQGIIIAFGRIIRCHPFAGNGGFDPVR